MSTESYPVVKLMTIQPVSGTIAYFVNNFSDEAEEFWYPHHAAIFVVKENANATQNFVYVYLDDDLTAPCAITIGFNKEDPALPIVRLTNHTPGRTLRVTDVIYADDFKKLLSAIQRCRHETDYAPEDSIKVECAKAIREDIDFLKEELSLKGLKMFSNVERLCEEEIESAKYFLDNFYREV